MPNHFHCIWKNVGSSVGADPCVRSPKQNMEPSTNIVIDDCDGIKGAHVGAPLQLDDMDLNAPNIIVDKYGRDEGAHANDGGQINNEGAHVGHIEGAHMGAPLQVDLGEHTGSPLSAVVRWFKTMSTNEYIRGVNELGWMPFDRKLWQRNYYEHIIRDDMSLQTIAYYIVNNPAQWQNDEFYQPPRMV